MKKLFIAVLFVSSLVRAEGTDQNSHTNQSNTNQSNQSQQTAQTQQRQSKLYEYVSACMAQRPSVLDTEALIKQYSR